MYLLIVTGLSGAGKSQALRYLEDLGFYCVDNLPAAMVTDFVRMCIKATPSVERAALVIDSRESVFQSDMENCLRSLEGLDVQYEILFLDCRDFVLERRYSETRRRHPLSNYIDEGVAKERELLKTLRERANYILDTSNLKPIALHHALKNILHEKANRPFNLIVESFGYKRGVPFEADIVLDMRFLPNPFYEQELRHLSGLDMPVRDYVAMDERYIEFIDGITIMLDKLIPAFAEQGKHRLMVAFGCTGGRHRSVCAANEVYERLKSRYNASIVHRDLSDEGLDIRGRTTGD